MAGAGRRGAEALIPSPARGEVGSCRPATIAEGSTITNAQRLALRLSEIRQKLNDLSGRDDLTEDEAGELRTLSAEYPRLEERHRAALIAEATDEAAAEDDPGDGDGEDRERAELRSRSRLSAYVGAALDGLPVTGAEAELSAAAGCPARSRLSYSRSAVTTRRSGPSPRHRPPRMRTWPASSRPYSTVRRLRGSA